MSNHTPGPWSAGHTFQKYHAVTCGDGRAVALTGTLFSADSAESIANAHLIAAAPELLEALIGLEQWVGGTAYDRARAAIAKAKGEQP